MDALKKIFSTILGIPESMVTEKLSPANTPSWDSLNAIILVTEIEHVYGVKFSFDEAMGVKNFGDAVELVKRKSGKV